MFLQKWYFCISAVLFSLLIFSGCEEEVYKPANRAPFAESITVPTSVNTSVEILLKGSDPDGDGIEYFLDTDSASGIVLISGLPSVMYTPANDFTGVDSFTYYVSDGELDSPTAEVLIDVDNSAPAVFNDSITTQEDVPVDITLDADDPDDDTLQWLIYNMPLHGTLSGTAPELTYTPDPDYNGTDQIGFGVSDGLENSGTAFIAVTITEVNDRPSAVSRDLSTPPHTDLDITLSADDPEGDPVVFSIETFPDHGTLNLSALPVVTYRPEEGFTGSDSFAFSAADAGGTGASALVSIEVVSNPQWKTPATIPGLNFFYSVIDAGIDSSGNAVIVYPVDPGIGYRICRRDSGWAAAEILPGSETYPVYLGGSFQPVELAVSADGTACAAWRYRASLDSSDKVKIITCIYSPLSGWGTLETIDTGQISIVDLAAGIDSQGRVMLVWKNNSIGTDIMACRRLSVSGWQAPQSVGTGSYMYNARFSMAGSGKGIASWLDEESSGDYIKTCRFDPVSGWGSPAASGQGIINTFYYSYDIRNAIGDNGTALIAWRCLDSSNNYKLKHNTYVPDLGWQGSEPVGLNANAYLLGCGVDSSGNQMILWDKYSTKTLTVSRYDSSGTLAGTDSLATYTNDNSNCRLAVDQNGTAQVLYYNAAASTMKTFLFESCSGWSSGELIDSPPSSEYWDMDIRARNGNALCWWIEGEGSDDHTVTIVIKN